MTEHGLYMLYETTTGQRSGHWNIWRCAADCLGNTVVLHQFLSLERLLLENIEFWSLLNRSPNKLVLNWLDGRKKWLIMSICFGLAPLCFGDLWELFLKSFALMFAEVWHYFMLDTPPLQDAVLVLILSNISWDRWHIVYGSKENCENNRGRNSVLIWPLRQTDDANFFSPPSLLKFITLH